MTTKDVTEYHRLIEAYGNQNAVVRQCAIAVDMGHMTIIEGLCRMVDTLAAQNREYEANAVVEWKPAPAVIKLDGTYDGWTHADAIANLKRRMGVKDEPPTL